MAWGLAHFSAVYGQKSVPVPLRPKGAHFHLAALRRRSGFRQLVVSWRQQAWCQISRSMSLSEDYRVRIV